MRSVLLDVAATGLPEEQDGGLQVSGRRLVPCVREQVTLSSPHFITLTLQVFLHPTDALNSAPTDLSSSLTATAMSLSTLPSAAPLDPGAKVKRRCPHFSPH